MEPIQNWAKLPQANPNKICLDLLGFIRPNLDFSLGYNEIQTEIFPAPSVATRT
jgi:hypothetical protein